MSKDKVFKDMNNSFKMRLFFLKNLPSILFFGIKVIKVTDTVTDIGLPFKWRSQNPFRSIYAGAQFAAAEISTGLMVAGITQTMGKFSTLIIDVRITYIKKATSYTIFTCDEGDKIKALAEKAKATGEPQTITLTSTGRIKNSGEEVSRMDFTWSIKYKGE